ncbi:hypothetical protein OS493_036170 [Desmophyllum pertusum]|uniref:Uncharacterized protein n=1 Tax=Desmophyllum pertusum TaxID=174260 RepID=A0A9W9ZIE2_9CNID|nr:hypothetical protein OS493_036170 [Desmophyllum pertusum]
MKQLQYPLVDWAVVASSFMKSVCSNAYGMLWAPNPLVALTAARRCCLCKTTKMQLDPVTLCKTTKMKVPVNSEKEVKVYCEFDVNGNRANLLKKFLFTLVEKVSIPTRLIFGLKIRWMPGIGRGGPPLPIKPLRLPYSQPLVKQLAERQFIQQLLRESNSGHSTASSTPSSPPTKRQQTH